MTTLHFALSAAFACLIFASSVSAQKVVDKTVATISDGFQTELITLSDLRWQVALQPGSRSVTATRDELNAALQTLIEQRIYALEAKRLPSSEVSKPEIDEQIKRVMNGLTPAEFESRLRAVGFASVSDPEFQRIMTDRAMIEKFVTFRFRTFIVVTAKEEEAYYRDVYAPDFRQRFPGLLMPTLDEKRKEINERLVERRIATDIESYLESAKQRMSVVILSPV